MMNKCEKLALFKKSLLLNKEKVINSFDAFIEHHKETDNQEDYSEDKRSVLLRLCDKFRQTLETCRLPDLTDDWWFYEYALTNDSVDLTLNYCNEIEFDESGDTSTMTSSLEFILLSVKSDYLNVEQYAALHDVSTTTVRQWIRRGKLRTAKKLGRDWIIPELADKPQRGFENVSYFWTRLPQTVTDEFSYLKDYDSLYIYQDDDDKSLFGCILGCPGSDKRYRIYLNSAEREKLEVALISSNCVNAEADNVRFVPSK